MSEKLIRILDAAANRASEGLRVVEDYVRFILDDAHLMGLLKQIRHDLATTLSKIPDLDRHASRETQQDVGTTVSTDAESRRTDGWDVCRASLERTKQSLRSLEEYSKVTSPEAGAEFESLRYQFYTLEKALSLTQESLNRLENVTLCVLIDGCETIEEFTTLVQQLVEAGVGMIQLREKKLDDRELLTRAKELVRLKSESLAIINDRVDIAAATNADGVHLGQEDFAVKDARSILGSRKLLGVSTHNIAQARQAALDGANYLGAGPTFPSNTKQFSEFAGLEYLREIASEVQLPTFAIGGINLENLPQVIEAGISRIAVSGEIVGAADPKQAATNLLEALVNSKTLKVNPDVIS